MPDSPPKAISSSFVQPVPSCSGWLAKTVAWNSFALPASIAQPKADVARAEASLPRLRSRKVVGRQISWILPASASDSMPAPLACSTAPHAGHWKSSQISRTGASGVAVPG